MIRMMNGAMKLVEICAGVKRGENVLIVTDTEKVSIAEVLAAAAYAKGAETAIIIMTPRKMHSEEPPKMVAAAMKNADVIFAPTTYSISRTKATVEALKAGARMITMPDYTDEMLITGGIEADFMALKHLAERISKEYVGENIKVASPAGTSLKALIKGRKPNIETGICHKPGDFGPPPDVEVNIPPVEGSAEGLLLVDAAASGIGLIKDPIKVTVKGGFITSIEGKEEAEKLKKILEAAKDPNAYNIAEIGLGLNPKARLIGRLLEDEGVLGTAHIGVGSSLPLGGKIQAPLHIDLIIRNPTIEIDGKKIIENGELKIQ
ncbi:MAG: leucyl aminopeptidase [Candidatus Bathyarchaeia archaeon]